MNTELPPPALPSRRLPASALGAFVALSLLAIANLQAARQTINFDHGWRFALGHATDPSKDFGHATGYFSYLAKTGFGDGPASIAFDDRGWREVDLPHDWAVEMPFDPNGSHSHGYKAVGPRFPQNSVGWYRKQFQVPESDLGRKISIELDGVYRDAKVFVNGFFVGNEPSGYLGQAYDLSDYLNYGGENTLVVRANASMEEGWFYEGAGIYRHVRLVKTERLHFVQDGLWVDPEIEGQDARLRIQSEFRNDHATAQACRLKFVVKDAAGVVVAKNNRPARQATPLELGVEFTEIALTQPALWSINQPYLYTLQASLLDDTGKTLDRVETHFGIRSLRFDPDHGFFLNGEHVILKGSNNHQDHAGVGAAIPDSLQAWRIRQLQSMGSNAYRASHNPPTPELLDACDRLGMLVIDETRLMGSNVHHLSELERLIRRDRNHPSVILWSLGNEEWGIEGNIKGARITKTMQDFAHHLDPSRATTVAISGGWGGTSTVVQCAGVNYIKQGDTDKQHREYPWQVIIGTEETTTQQTRGIYYEDKAACHLPPLEDGSSGFNAEIGWKHYAARPYTAGIFYWTGFDYRGEPTPYAYPAISSQFGILDTCGFPKDGYYYLKSWWTSEPVLHLFPHWNWSGREGKLIDVRIHSNCATAELFLNGESLGKKDMEPNGHLAWQVPYSAGELRAEATWANGEKRSTHVKTTSTPHTLTLARHPLSNTSKEGGVIVVTIGAKDTNGIAVPTANNIVSFHLDGPGRIIGVGNGNPSSLEPDVYIRAVRTEKIGEWAAPNPADTTTPVIFETTFDRPVMEDGESLSLLFNALGEEQVIQINGKVVDATEGKTEVKISAAMLHSTGNRIRIAAKPYPVWQDREGLAQFHPATIRLEGPPPVWKRCLFNGLAQVLVETNGEDGALVLHAESEGLSGAKLKL